MLIRTLQRCFTRFPSGNAVYPPAAQQQRIQRSLVLGGSPRRPTEERRRLNAQGTGPLYSGGRGLWRRRLLSTRFFLSEFKTDFAIVQLQMRRKWPAFLGNELRQQIGLARGDQLQYLLFGNFAVQNYFADAEGAGFR